MNFEDLLFETGGFGRYQWLLYFWFQACIWVMVPNMALMSFGGIKAVVVSNITAFNETANQTELIICPPETTIFYSIACQWGLIGASQNIIGYITSSQMVGVFFGPLVVGQISDAIGRRRVFLIFLCFMSIFGLASACSTHWQLFLVARVLLGFCLGALVSVKFTLMAEFIVPKWRPIIFVGGWPLGYLYFCLLAYLTSHWRWLIVASNSAAMVPILMTLFFVDESPKWLMEKKRYSEARKIFEKIAKRNGVANEKLTEALENLTDLTIMLHPDHQTNNKIYSYWHLFRTWKDAKATVSLCLSWIVTAFVSYGLLFNIGTFVGHPALNLFIANILKATVNGCVSLADRKFPKIGRRHFHQVGLVIISLSMASMMILYATGMDKTHKTLLLIAAMTGMIFTGMVWMPVEVYTAEIFPTALRNMGNALCGSSARIGSILAPLVSNAQWPPLLYLVMLILLLINLVIAVLFLPETKLQKLPDINHELDAVDLHHPSSPTKLKPVVN